MAMISQFIMSNRARREVWSDAMAVSTSVFCTRKAGQVLASCLSVLDLVPRLRLGLGQLSDALQGLHGLHGLHGLV